MRYSRTAQTIPPIVNYADGGSWSDWALTMDQIAKMDFDTVIPGHGPVVTKSEFLQLRSKMLAIMERVRGLEAEVETLRKRADGVE